MMVMLITSVAEVNVCPMGASTSRLYSTLAQTLSNASLIQPPLSPPCPEQPDDVERREPDELLSECRNALSTRPPRLHRSFIAPGNGSRRCHPFRVMQWNILAQALGEDTDGFIRCPLDALNWAERKYLILEEMLTYRPDIMCLQEVDHYFDTFQPALASLGYQGTFCPKPHSPCLKVAQNNGPDGCALFFKQKRFELVESTSLRLRAMRLNTNQVAVAQKLRCRETGQLLCVAVTHLKAHAGCEGLRSAQGADLLWRLQKMTQGTWVPLLVCGDLNAGPGEDVYHHFAGSDLGLRSAYTLLSTDGRAEPPYTAWTVRPSGESCQTLDYVWYSQHAFVVNAVLGLPTAEQIGPNRLPSYNYPSDHLSLVCDLSFQAEPHGLL